jgi:cytochrome c-type biogenesis protein CcmF
VIAWRRASARKLAERIRVPLGSLLGAAAVLLLAGVRDIYAIVSFSLSAFVIATTVMEFVWGTRARSRATGETPARAFLSLLDRNKRRYGGFVVHLGFILIMIGVTGSSAFKQEATATLKRGEAFSIGRYSLTFDDMDSGTPHPNADFTGARLLVSDGGRGVGTLVPGMNFYKTGQTSTEVAIRYTLRDDLYTIMTGFDPQTGQATLKAYLNPLINWIWIGGAVLILGSWFAMLPDLRDRRRDIEARLQAVTGHAA